MTDRRQRQTRMADVEHAHPHTDRGAINRPFVRGPVVAADGGEREARDESESFDADEEETANARQRMKDVNHEPPSGEGANPVFERGGKEEPVEPDVSEE